MSCRRLAHGSEILRPVRVCRDMTLSLDSVRVQWGQRCIWSRVLRRNNTVTVTDRPAGCTHRKGPAGEGNGRGCAPARTSAGPRDRQRRDWLR